MEVLLDPFRFEFFRNGLIVATISGGICALIGVYVVLRNMSYIGHGLSHAIFGGAVASFLVGINFYLGAGAWGFASALMVNRVARRRSIGADAAIGVITTASFAFGVALISRNAGFTRNFEAALFGNVLGVNRSDVIIVTVVAAAVAGILIALYRPMLFLTFDADVASVFGVPTARLDALFALLLAATVIATMQVLGVTLIAAALVIPPVVARMVTDRFRTMLAISVVVGVASGFVGMYLSFYLDIASGASIVLTQASVFVLVYIATSRGRSGRMRLAGVSSH
ncbi:MAG: metal ABC transporter permease [Actinomycetia bacterium]|nr:metal ABC transporter permease [Actinomycetes bacterium]